MHTETELYIVPPWTRSSRWQSKWAEHQWNLWRRGHMSAHRGEGHRSTFTLTLFIFCFMSDSLRVHRYKCRHICTSTNVHSHGKLLQLNWFFADSGTEDSRGKLEGKCGSGQGVSKEGRKQGQKRQEKIWPLDRGEWAKLWGGRAVNGARYWSKQWRPSIEGQSCAAQMEPYPHSVLTKKRKPKYLPGHMRQRQQ